jgi:hypothetical protein
MILQRKKCISRGYSEFTVRWLNNEKGCVQVVLFNQPTKPHEYDNPMYMHEPLHTCDCESHAPRVDIHICDV